MYQIQATWWVVAITKLLAVQLVLRCWSLTFFPLYVRILDILILGQRRCLVQWRLHLEQWRLCARWIFLGLQCKCCPCHNCIILYILCGQKFRQLRTRLHHVFINVAQTVNTSTFYVLWLCRISLDYVLVQKLKRNTNSCARKRSWNAASVTDFSSTRPKNSAVK